MGNAPSTEHLLPCSEALWGAATPPPELRAQADALRAACAAPAPPAGATLVLYLSVPARSPTPQPGAEAAAAAATAAVAAAAAEAAPQPPPPPPAAPCWAEAQVLGFAHLELRGAEAFVSGLTIAPAHRGKGHSARFLAALRAWLAASQGVLHAWPRAPAEEALEWVRAAALAPPVAHLAAWLLLHGEAAGFALPAELAASGGGASGGSAGARAAAHGEALAALSAPGALAALARRQQWSLTALIKAWGVFLAGTCSFQEEHALAVALMMGVDVFGQDAGLTGEEEEEEEGEEEEEEEEEEGEEGDAEGGAAVASVRAHVEGEAAGAGPGAAGEGAASGGSGGGGAPSSAAAPAPPAPPAAAAGAANRRGKRTYAAAALAQAPAEGAAEAGQDEGDKRQAT